MGRIEHLILEERASKKKKKKKKNPRRKGYIKINIPPTSRSTGSFVYLFRTSNEKWSFIFLILPPYVLYFIASESPSLSFISFFFYRLTLYIRIFFKKLSMYAG